MSRLYGLSWVLMFVMVGLVLVGPFYLSNILFYSLGVFALGLVIIDFIIERE